MIQSLSSPTFTIVVSKGQSRAPDKRSLEATVAEAAATRAGVDVLVVPHLYDLAPKGETIQRLRAIEGDIILLTWIFPRAAHWVFDRAGIRGQFGEVSLKEVLDEDEEEEPTDPEAMDENPLTETVLEDHPRPDRRIFTLDLRLATDPQTYLDEIDRICGLEATPSTASAVKQAEPGGLFQIEEPTNRRWYPVIDFSRCTNCMECIDFCLFGVYGVDDVETILVEQPDSCRKGCPACSRVCPANAIIFPQHKAPGIAGSAAVDGGGLKIDLSLLFGAPDKDEDPIATAARERDEQLLLAGRNAVGIDDQLAKRQADIQAGPADELDQLLDELDALDL
ncbi:4Fe-4S binding domain protein [Roseimaritima multifibrata]|uniref:4Fe-4S binding domain protein n=1 Tax=Roseimaritima multifibrata TaxID=1930274 RepID=A0A517MDZ1_9BACT|nr:ferredoxin family protein [Roseimaritima multifibrata]QDS93101.1 4Fe-4S binding domain protein [Roseimaritima multifibrata]